MVSFLKAEILARVGSRLQLAQAKHLLAIVVWSNLLVRHVLDVMHIEKNILFMLLASRDKRNKDADIRRHIGDPLVWRSMNSNWWGFFFVKCL